MLLESIYEPNFSENSHGFRPYRSCHTALLQIERMFTGAKWFVEGDIQACFDSFDHINHAILLKRLYHMGIKDRRVLQIIKAMLKAGVMDECGVNEEGTPQGGLISPLLANVYLDIMDEWVSKQWESKRTQFSYGRQDPGAERSVKEQT